MSFVRCCIKTFKDMGVTLINIILAVEIRIVENIIGIIIFIFSAASVYCFVFSLLLIIATGNLLWLIPILGVLILWLFIWFVIVLVSNYRKGGCEDGSR